MITLTCVCMHPRVDHEHGGPCGVWPCDCAYFWRWIDPDGIRVVHLPPMPDEDGGGDEAPPSR